MLNEPTGQNAQNAQEMKMGKTAAELFAEEDLKKGDLNVRRLSCASGEAATVADAVNADPVFKNLGPLHVGEYCVRLATQSVIDTVSGKSVPVNRRLDEPYADIIEGKRNYPKDPAALPASSREVENLQTIFKALAQSPQAAQGGTLTFTDRDTNPNVPVTYRLPAGLAMDVAMTNTAHDALNGKLVPPQTMTAQQVYDEAKKCVTYPSKTTVAKCYETGVQAAIGVLPPTKVNTATR